MALFKRRAVGYAVDSTSTPPGFMKPFKEQKNVKAFFKPVIFLYPKLFRGSFLTMQEVGRAMIKTVTDCYRKQILEVEDIKELGR